MCDKSYTTPRELPADTESVSELTEAVARLTGMEISVWDSDFRPCGYSGQTKGNLCNLLHGCGLGRELCVGSDNEALRTAQERGPYCYRCPIGLTEFAVPIRRGERLLGFVIAGKVAENIPDCDAELRRTVLSRCPEAERLGGVGGGVRGGGGGRRLTLTPTICQRRASVPYAGCGIRTRTARSARTA